MLNRILIAGIALILALCIGLYFYVELQKAAFDASLPEPPATEAAEQNTPRERQPRGTNTPHAGYRADYTPMAQATRARSRRRETYHSVPRICNERQYARR